MMSLHIRIILLLAPLVLGPIIGVGWVAYGQVRSAALAQIEGEIEAAIRAVRQQVSLLRSHAQSNLALFAQSQLVTNYLLMEDEGERFTFLQPTLMRQLSDYQLLFPDYYEIRVLAPDGFEDTRVTVGFIPNISEEAAETPFFQALSASENGVHSGFYQDPNTGQLALMVGRAVALPGPVFDPITAEEQLRGYLALTVSLDALVEALSALRIGSEGAVFLIDHEGQNVFPIHVFQRGWGGSLSKVWARLRMACGRFNLMVIPCWLGLRESATTCCWPLHFQPGICRTQVGRSVSGSPPVLWLPSWVPPVCSGWFCGWC